MYRYSKDFLDNGLRVVTVEAPHLHRAEATVYVRAGSRHETARTNGVSHFLEHLFFRGCERFPDGQAMNARVEDVGGDLNGLTSRDSGTYYTGVHPGHVPVALEVLGEMLRAPLLKDVEIEREVILEEMLDEVDADGRDVDVDNLVKQAAFGDHGLSLKIAGTPDSVRALTLDDLRTHHQRFYVASNMVLAVAGPVRRDEVLALARTHFGAFPTGTRSVDEPPPAWPSGPTVVDVAHETSQTSLALVFPAPPAQHPDFVPLRVLARVLDDGLSSRLQQNVVDKRGLAYSVGAAFDFFADMGLVDVGAANAHAKSPAVTRELLRILGELCDVPVGEEELARAKRRFRIDIDYSLDSTGALCAWFGGDALYKEPVEFAERAETIDRVTADDVQRVARTIFRRSRLLACAVGKMDGRTRTAWHAAVEAAEALPA